jgi:hypothetical protein
VTPTDRPRHPVGAEDLFSQTRPHHPAASLFPGLSQSEYVALLDSIRADGVQDPVWLDTEGRLIDGRHREAAAFEAGVECPTRVIPDGADPVLFALRMNGGRRNLTAQQRAAILLLAEAEGQAPPELAEARAKAAEQEKAGRALEPGVPRVRTDAAIGRLAAVSGKTVARVARAAAESGNRLDALRAIASGEKTAQQTLAGSKAKSKAVTVLGWKRALKTLERIVPAHLELELGRTADPDDVKYLMKATPAAIRRLEELMEIVKAEAERRAPGAPRLD